jgi:hypothetical protein
MRECHEQELGADMPFVEYDHDDFPTGTLPSYERRLDVTWDDLLWSATTVGRPNLYHVFQHGDPSVYEAIFRWSMIRMALEQRGPRGTRFSRTDTFKHMDPTEKGAVNYFLGLVICKLFAAKRLAAPWTLHLDIWRNALNVALLSGRSRPDMIAQSATSAEWYAFECKGRASAPGEPEKRKAKNQAIRIVSVGGANCALHIGAITFYRNDTLQFYWRDPEPKSREPIRIPRPGNAWAEYYQPFTEVYRMYAPDAERAPASGSRASIEQLDLTLKLHPSIAELLFASDWQGARRQARELQVEFKEGGYQPDGLAVIAGDSWRSRYDQRTLLR